MELNQALHEIADIRAQVARTAVFRGYRSPTVAISAGIALVAGVLQWAFIDDPLAMLDGYLKLWTAAAACSIGTTGVGMIAHLRRSRSALTLQHTRAAIERFIPCLAVGAAVTVAIAHRAPEAAWMLPGLWCLIFSLGIFASGSLLPRAMAVVAAYYFMCGSFLLGCGVSALAPWTMGLVFGVGQFSTAGILYVTLERPDAHEG